MVRARSPEARVHEGEEGWGEGFVAREPHTETISRCLWTMVRPSRRRAPFGLQGGLIPLLVWADRRVWCGARWKSSTGAKAGGVLKRSLRIMPLDCTVGMILPDVITPRLARRAATQRRL